MDTTLKTQTTTRAPTRTRRRIVAIALGIGLVFAGCGGGADDEGTPAAAGQATATTEGAATSTATETTTSAAATTTAATTAPATSTSETEVARADFAPRAHPVTGAATMIDTGSGARQLALTGFKTDAGPKLRVILAKGPIASDADVKDFVDLGALKSTTGDQQYDVPADTDVAAYSSVLIWCADFSVSFAQADLKVT